MKRACRPLALLLMISTPLSAEELPANSLPTLPPVTTNTLETMPLVAMQGTVNGVTTFLTLVPVAHLKKRKKRKQNYCVESVMASVECR